MQQRAQLAAAGLVALTIGSLVSACGSDPAPASSETAGTAQPSETSQTQSALLASVIDNFDDGDVSDWHAFADPASVMTEHRISTSRAQSGTMSFKLTYTI